MYKVIKFFTDLQDSEHPYNVGDEYPRKGKEATADRIAELMSAKNKQGVPLIEKIEDPKPTSKAKTKKTKTE